MYILYISTNFLNYLKEFYKKLEEIYYLKNVLIFFGTFYKLF
uniref:Uncharacterized protein n=1 Tax=viral metagenome TaxID=1070528 RepID=A0A6C0AEP9_9ZZZZ